MKKFIFILSLLALVMLSACSAFESNPVEDFIYEENDEGGITITRYIGQDDTVIIPDTIQNKPVTQIGVQAFVTKNTVLQNPSNVVTSLQMPDTVTTINDCAFEECEQLEKIILSNNLTQIGACSFQKCKSLKQVTIPSTVKCIGDEAFSESGLETIVFENGIEKIEGYGAFAGTQLEQVVFPSTLKEIGPSAFAACSNLETIALNEGLVSVGHKAFCANPKLKEIVIPKTVKFITEMEFTSCPNLEKIMFDGDAPSTFQYSDEISGIWEPYDVDFTIYYHKNANGFTSPKWYGYPTKLW